MTFMNKWLQQNISVVHTVLAAPDTKRWVQKIQQLFEPGKKKTYMQNSF